MKIIDFLIEIENKISDKTFISIALLPLPTSPKATLSLSPLFKLRRFSHVLRSKHVIPGSEIDRLRRSSQIHCLAGMHRGFCGRPTRGKRRSAPLHLVKNALFFNVLGVFLKSNVGSNLINLINFERGNRRYSALNSLAALACLIFRFILLKNASS